jgi:hypothetical protein
MVLAWCQHRGACRDYNSMGVWVFGWERIMYNDMFNWSPEKVAKWHQQVVDARNRSYGANRTAGAGSTPLMRLWNALAQQFLNEKVKNGK